MKVLQDLNGVQPSSGAWARPLRGRGGVRRERKRQARREQFLDAGLDLVIEEGLDTLTVARLAASLDVAVGSLYSHFDSKAALVSALQRRALSQFLAELSEERNLAGRWRTGERRDGPTEPGPHAALFDILVVQTAWLRDAARRPERHGLMDALLASARPIPSIREARALESALAPLLAVLADVVAVAVTQGALERGDAGQRAQLMWAAVRGLTHNRRRDRLQPPALQADALTTSLLWTLLVGWGAEPEVLVAAFALFTSWRE